MNQSILIVDTPDCCENCLCLGGFIRAYAMCRAKARLINDPYKNQDGVHLFRIERRKKMACAKKCDRCGKLYEEYNTEKDSKNTNGIRTLNIDYQRKCYSHKAVDLCPECMASFWIWMENVGKGERDEQRNS